MGRGKESRARHMNLPQWQRQGELDKHAPVARRRFDEMLRPLGVQVMEVEGDGNCFFRACSAQLQLGDELEEGVADDLPFREAPDHMALREAVCEYMWKHREEYQPFIDASVCNEAEAGDQSVSSNDEGRARELEVYVERMRREGVWAGHVEIHATSALCHADITVYMLNSPSYSVRYADSTGKHPAPRQFRLAYYDTGHYDAVVPIDALNRRIQACIAACKPGHTGQPSKRAGDRAPSAPLSNRATERRAPTPDSNGSLRILEL